jgi:hypothetical protein
MYGTIGRHQEKQYFPPESDSRLNNPDFAAFECAYGWAGMRITNLKLNCHLRWTGRSSPKRGILSSIMHSALNRLL